jgi:hypothetical protein
MSATVTVPPCPECGETVVHAPLCSTNLAWLYELAADATRRAEQLAGVQAQLLVMIAEVKAAAEQRVQALHAVTPPDWPWDAPDPGKP